jgi:hypothetical protein
LQRTGSNPNGEIRPGFVDATLWAMREIHVAGADVTGIALALERPLVLSGRIVFEGHSIERPKDLARLTVGLFLPDVLSRPGTAVETIAAARPAFVNPDETFTLGNLVPGRYRFFVAGPGIDNAGWWPKSAMLDGHDLLDGDVEIAPGMNLAGVVVTLTDRRSELSGSLQTSDGAPASDVFVIAYSAERRDWSPHARRVRAVRPGDDGHYTVKDLPAGAYLVAAVTDIDEGEWQEPAFLEQLVPASVAVSIAEGERKVLHLQIGGRSPHAAIR